MEAKLKRRKLDALRRGVHRVGAGEDLPVRVHVVGIGKTGIDVIAAMCRAARPGDPPLSALAIDIGESALRDLRVAVEATPMGTADVVTVALDPPDPAALGGLMQQYPTCLTLEAPSSPGADWFRSWLPPGTPLGAPGGSVPRAVAKAAYGAAYYLGPRRMEQALRRFAATVEAGAAQSVIALVFGIGGGTGSGIALDLARHLCTRIFGRRVLMAGIGVAPCGGDPPAYRGAAAYAALNELDCLGDEAKNEGVVRSCGELFRNPFTAGVLIVPQQPAWAATGDLARTHARVDAEIASLLGGHGGIEFWELLRLLNWVAAPSTQHSAARTPWGARWVHLLGYADAQGGVPVDGRLKARMGLLPGYQPEYVELRGSAVGDMPARIEAAFKPDVPPALVDGGRQGVARFILPSAAKTDLDWFFDARDAYDAAGPAARRAAHALLLEQGLVLSEPSTRLAGMAGASVDDSGSWIAVPYAALRGGERPATAAPPLQEAGHAA